MGPHRGTDFIAAVRRAMNTYTALSIWAVLMLLGLIATAIAGYLVAHSVPIIQWHAWKSLTAPQQLFYVGVVGLVFFCGGVVTMLNLFSLRGQRKWEKSIHESAEARRIDNTFYAPMAEYRAADLPKDHPEYLPEVR